MFIDRLLNDRKLATYVILIQLPCERCCSSSSLSFSPQISTGGSSGAFQIRTVAAEHPRAVWIQFSLEHQFILSNFWIQFSVSGSFLQAHPGSRLNYATAGEYLNLSSNFIHFYKSLNLVSLQSATRAQFWWAGQSVTYIQDRLQWKKTESGAGSDVRRWCGCSSDNCGVQKCDRTSPAIWGWWRRHSAIPESSNCCRNLMPRQVKAIQSQSDQ